MQQRKSIGRREFLGGLGRIAGVAAAANWPVAAQQGGEWRNRQGGMAYRALGRTGMMISEVGCGGDPVRLNNYEHLNVALEMGMNYLDMAPAYGKGECEETYGKLLGGSSKREKVFLTTKISSFSGVRNRQYKEIFDGLPGGRQSAILKRAEEMRRMRGIERPGYFFEFFPGQRNQIPPVYLANAMMADYAHKVDGSRQFREAMIRSVEESLKRVGTDYFDVVMCPHGACAPEELEVPELNETFQLLKKQGKARFLGVSSHTDPAGILRKATALGYYDVVMVAYNIANGDHLDHPIREAAAQGVGVVGMKVAMAVATQYETLRPLPQWRVEKLNRLIPGDMKAPMKAYLWALQHPGVSAVVSNLWDANYVRENLSVAGKTVELQPA